MFCTWGEYGEADPAIIIPSFLCGLCSFATWVVSCSTCGVLDRASSIFNSDNLVVPGSDKDLQKIRSANLEKGSNSVRPIGSNLRGGGAAVSTENELCNGENNYFWVGLSVLSFVIIFVLIVFTVNAISRKRKAKESMERAFSDVEDDVLEEVM